MSVDLLGDAGSGSVLGCPPSPPLGPPPSPTVSGSILVHAIEVAFYTNSQVLIYIAVGAYCVHTGLIDGAVLKKMAGLVLGVLFPALTFSMFVAYSGDNVARWSPIILSSLVHIYCGGLLGKVGAKVCMLGSPYEELCILSVAFGNVAVLPFVMIGPIVNNWRGAEVYRGGQIDAATATRYAGGMVALYSSMWILNFFSIGKWYVSTIPELGEAPGSPRAPDDASPEPAWKRRLQTA